MQDVLHRALTGVQQTDHMEYEGWVSMGTVEKKAHDITDAGALLEAYVDLLEVVVGYSGMN